jgi:hypothetical protein
LQDFSRTPTHGPPFCFCFSALPMRPGLLLVALAGLFLPFCNFFPFPIALSQNGCCSLDGRKNSRQPTSLNAFFSADFFG